MWGGKTILKTEPFGAEPKGPTAESGLTGARRLPPPAILCRYGRDGRSVLDGPRAREAVLVEAEVAGIAAVCAHLLHVGARMGLGS